ncbi:hypothetical protein PCANC_21208 [Puccinia coronata f. sp. avenae]|uniref:Integrase catalytic domain-containing protein n=1 Tax=Puccinia coronata f. sp. avenae TaxID=200324 RepID=A0A2N5UGU6_9BASI|nr:hypothetical protein PCANC_21208 [Puccinia coronata f. sp. avenae]
MSLSNVSKSSEPSLRRASPTSSKPSAPTTGGKYLSTEFTNYLQCLGIAHEPGPPHSPQLNGVAERANQTIGNLVRCALLQAKTPKSFWADALRHCFHTYNSTPCKTPGGFKAPTLVLGLSTVNLSDLHPFGCMAWYKVPKANRKKLDPKGRAAILLSYLLDGNGFYFMATHTAYSFEHPPQTLTPKQPHPACGSRPPSQRQLRADAKNAYTRPPASRHPACATFRLAPDKFNPRPQAALYIQFYGRSGFDPLSSKSTGHCPYQSPASSAISTCSYRARWYRHCSRVPEHGSDSLLPS